jgi:predicted nucleotidyltransferase
MLNYIQAWLRYAMKRNDVLTLVQAHRNSLIQLGVKSLDLFGSVARDEAHPNSDVDFLVEFTQPSGLFQLLQVKHYLEDILECPVDLGTRTALREHLREPVLKDLIHVL